jgi:predicted nucleic acid-binding protein
LRIFIDTNLLLRAVNNDDPQVKIARRAIKALFRRGEKIVISPQVIYVFWVVATRPVGGNGLGFTTKGAVSAIKRWTNVMEIADDESGIRSIWFDLVQRYQVSGKPAHDARLVAAMIKHGIDRLLTFNDADFKRYAEITAESPLAVQSP